MGGGLGLSRRGRAGPGQGAAAGIRGWSWIMGRSPGGCASDSAEGKQQVQGDSWPPRYKEHSTGNPLGGGGKLGHMGLSG